MRAHRKRLVRFIVSTSHLQMVPSLATLKAVASSAVSATAVALRRWPWRAMRGAS